MERCGVSWRQRHSHTQHRRSRLQWHCTESSLFTTHLFSLEGCLSDWKISHPIRKTMLWFLNLTCTSYLFDTGVLMSTEVGVYIPVDPWDLGVGLCRLQKAITSSSDLFPLNINIRRVFEEQTKGQSRFVCQSLNFKNYWCNK